MGNPSFETLTSHLCCGGNLRFIRFYSETLLSKTTLAVYLPPQLKEGEKCPVIYCLSGLTGSYENFIIKANALRFAAKWGVALVAPDTSPRDTGIAGETDDPDIGDGAGFYVDATVAPWSEHYKMARFVEGELPAFIESHFPVDPDKCGIMGHSMGGMGALGIALRTPQKWKTVSAFAPIGNPSSVAWGQKVTEFYFGGDSRPWQHYDPCLLLEQGHKHPAPILVDQGLADEFWNDLKPEALAAAVNKSGQLAELRHHEGYDHSYWFVQSFIEDHMAHHAVHLKGQVLL